MSAWAIQYVQYVSNASIYNMCVHFNICVQLFVSFYMRMCTSRSDTEMFQFHSFVLWPQYKTTTMSNKKINKDEILIITYLPFADHIIMIYSPYFFSLSIFLFIPSLSCTFLFPPSFNRPPPSSFSRFTVLCHIAKWMLIVSSFDWLSQTETAHL